MKDTYRFAENTATIYHGQSATKVLVLLTADEVDPNSILPLLADGIALVNLSYADWNRDFSPWAAPAVFGDEAFAGDGMAYLQSMEQELLPALRHDFPNLPLVFCGYSLAGLFATWAAYQTSSFSAVASISGSLWFDGFLSYAESHHCLTNRLYFSVGDREKRTRNPRIQAVESNAVTLQQLLSSQGKETKFELNPGNHFVHAPERIAKGIQWVCQPWL